MIEGWQRSGLSPSAFARRHDLDYQRVRYWIARLAGTREPGQATPLAFAPVRIVETTDHAGATTPRETTATLDVLVGGAVVRVGHDFDAEHLQRVVAALGGAAC